MALLTARALSVTIGGRTLFGALDLAVGVGELVALVGPSGSGKTSLLRVLAYLGDPAAGEVRLRDRPPAEHGWPAWRRRVCYVAQRPILLEETVRASLERPFRYGTSAGPFPEARAATWLERLGLEPERLAQEARTLSEGQQQRVALVRALLVEPEVLLLDEPTAALDTAAMEAAEALVTERVREQQGGALIVTHDRAQAERWCDRVIDLGAYLANGAADA